MNEKTLAFKEYCRDLFEKYTDGIDYSVYSLQDFIKKLRDKGLKDSTIKAVLGELKRQALKKGFDVRGFDEVLKTVRYYRRANPFSQEELEKLFQALQGYHPIFYIFSLVLLHSGVRVSEALALTSRDFEVKVFKKHTDDFNYEEKEVLFVNVRKGKFNKPYRAGMPLLSDSEKAILKKFLSQRQDKPLWLYVIKYPKSIKEAVLTNHSVHKFYERLSKQLGFRVYPHRFRYTYASQLLAKGFSLPLVQSWLGHSSPSTTLLAYARAIEELELARLL